MNKSTRYPVSPINPIGFPGGLRHPRRNVLLLLGFYNVPVHLGIARFAHEAGWSLCDDFIRVGRPPLWWRGDGILSLITSTKDLRALENYPALPLVDLSKGWIGGTMPPGDRASGIGKPRVLYDNKRIGLMAAEHFLHRGFKHIAYLNTGNYWLDRERIPAFRRAVNLAGCQFMEIEYHRLFPANSRHQSEDYIAAHRWLVKTIAGLPKPIGIMVSSDNLAPRLMQACEDAGVAVPEELAILGCDNDPMVCDYAPITLSSVDNDWDRIGYEAARLLDHLMDGGAAPAHPILIPPKGVVTRMSTNLLAVPDPGTARALRFIWENFHTNIGTAEVAGAVKLHRRKLERDFRIHLGRSVNEEITRVRMECARKLLLDGTSKAIEVAEKTGYADIVTFSNAFLRATGVRPSVFRKQARNAHPDIRG